MNRESRIRHTVSSRPVAVFFVLTYAFTWAIWIPLVGPLQGLLTFDVPLWALGGLLLGAFGPTVAAVTILWLSDGWAAVRGLLGRFGKWRVDWWWYAVAVLVWPAVFGVTYGAYALGTGLPVSVTPAVLATLPLVYVVRFALAVPTGPLAEEAGWRGFALPELQSRHGPLVASLVVGLAWAFWHLPMFFVPGVALPASGTGDPVSILLYVVRTVGISIIFTWAYNGTGGSLLLDVLFHAGINAGTNAFVTIFFTDVTPATITEFVVVETVVVWLVAVGLVATGRLTDRTDGIVPPAGDGGTPGGPNAQ